MVRFLDSDSAVYHLHLEATIGKCVFEESADNLDFASHLGEFYSVTLEVQDNLLQTVCVSANQIVVIGEAMELCTEVELVEVSLALLERDNLVYDSFDVNIAAVFAKLIGIYSRESQYVFHTEVEKLG